MSTSFKSTRQNHVEMSPLVPNLIPNISELHKDCLAKNFDFKQIIVLIPNLRANFSSFSSHFHFPNLNNTPYDDSCSNSFYNEVKTSVIQNTILQIDQEIFIFDNLAFRTLGPIILDPHLISSSKNMKFMHAITYDHEASKRQRAYLLLFPLFTSSQFWLLGKINRNY